MNLRIFLISLGVFVVGLLIMFGISSYDYYEAIHADDPIDPTIMIDMGQGTVVR